jgi:hypothetical protein
MPCAAAWKAGILVKIAREVTALVVVGLVAGAPDRPLAGT